MIMKVHLALATMLALTFSVASFAPAYAMGDGDDSTPKPKCKKGEVVKNGKCVKAHSGVLPDEDLYRQGRALAQAGDYEGALMILQLVANQNDPRVLNYIGYSHRKSGRLEQAFGYYSKAIEIDPNFVLAREYLGEGYVAAGRIDLAKAQLTEIANRCGTTCEEYQELAEHIETGIN
jgi:tetratricopeptide (TPR) repeat protein